MEKIIVPRLEQIAFKVSFKEILSNLALCQDHCPEDIQLETVAFSSRLSTCPLFSSQSLVQFVRKRLDHYLVGEMNDTIRKKFVEQFNNRCGELPDNMVEPWVFLECVLDSTFKELETHATFPDSEPDLKLVQTIAKRSSLLQKLKIDFSQMVKGTKVGKVVPMIASLSSLHCLTSLNLFKLDESHRSVFKFIGNSCPLLTHLSIIGFRVSPKDILSIILGEYVDDLFPESAATKNLWEENKCLDYLLAPPELLVPFCFTLRHLKLGEADWDMTSDECWSAASFALRHFPLLEKLDGHSTSFAIDILRGNWGPATMEQNKQDGIDALLNLLDSYNVQVPPEARSQIVQTISWQSQRKIAEEFKKACQEAVANRPTSRPLNIEKSLIDSLTAGILSLSSIDYVPLKVWTILTVSEFCPKLKEATFGSPIILTPRPGQSVAEDEPKLNPPGNILTYLKKWPKLETITLVKVGPKAVKSILLVFSPSLKQLTLVSCGKINLMDLIPCRHLEKLRILKSSSLADTKAEPGRLSPSSFLPQLKSFESDICLGLWTLWLEGKPNLSHVVLNCCHIGTNGSIHSDWTSVPKKWPQLEKLHIRRCTGLTMSMVAYIVPQLAKLKELSLPKRITKSEPELAVKTWEELSYRSVRPIRFCFVKGRSVTSCSLLPVEEEGAMDEDDSLDSA